MCYYNKQQTQKHTKQSNSTKKLLKDLTTSYYTDLGNTKKDKNNKIAYVSSMAPVEILRAFDFKLYFPENHAAILGAKKLVDNNITKTVSTTGINELCCSYLLSDIGCNIEKNSPLANYNLPPEPDLIVYNTTQCTEIKHWLTYYAKKHNVPIFGIETPHTIQKNDKLLLEYVANQLKKLIAEIEITFEIKLDPEKLRTTMKNAKECSEKWSQLLELNKQKPAPLTFFDHCNLMAVSVLLRGEERATKFYQEAINEINKEVKKGTTCLQKEQKRLIWCGLPVWGGYKYLINLFEKLNSNIVNSVYASSWVFDLDEEKPLNSLAKAYTELFINLTEEEKLKYIVKIVQEWEAEGIIFHHSQTCKRNSDNYYGLSKKLKELYNIPSITFEADHNNLKAFNAKRFTVLTEALLEQIERQKVS